MRDEQFFNNSSTHSELVGKKKYISVVSMFSGCGGLDLGLEGNFDYLGDYYEALPFKTIAAYDTNPDACESYRLNLNSIISDVDLASVNMKNLPEAEMLTGGFPCQDFSSSGTKRGFSGRRGQLYRCMVDYMMEHKPKYVLGENVPYLKRLNKGRYLDTILQDFSRCGYKFEVWEIYGPEYGLPQSRRRLFLMGVRNDINGFPVRPWPITKNKPRSIDDAIDDLMNISDEAIPNQSQYFRASKATSGGGQGDHKNKSNHVAYCIRANSRGRIQFHHKLDRRLTVRECARLQSFPDEFVFPFTTQRNLTLIGNAVPPILGHIVGKRINDFESGVLTATQHSAVSDFNFQTELALG